MSQLRRAIREIHRRSLWQVLSIYMVGSWVALQVVESLTESAGLPDWVPSFALVLLVLGLPMCLATAFVQEGVGGGSEGPAAPRGDEDPRPEERVPPGAAPAGSTPAGPDSGPRPAPSDPGLGLRHALFTWKNALVGGLLAFGLLGSAVGVYFFMWSQGIGPVGNLVAQGVLDERERVVLADFGNATSDSLLGGVVTEALRVDLLESPVLTVVDPNFAQQALRRMERDPRTPMTAEVAREVAVREGIKAVIQGEVGSAGQGYVLTAHLVEAGSGRTLAAFRETAGDDGALIAAIDKLSQGIREKAGESLRSIKGGEGLEAVTTSSLDALRKYTQAAALGDRGELDRAIELVEEAVALDSTFAMAWRKLAVLLGNANRGGPESDSAVTRAYRLRHRLPDRERYATVAHYHYTVTDSLDQAERAYRNLLDAHPDDGIALNNLGLILLNRDEPEAALKLFERAVSGPGESSVAHLNRVDALVALERPEATRAAAARYEERYPGDFRSLEARIQVAIGEEAWEEASTLAEEGAGRFDTNLARRRFAHVLGELAITRGRLEEAEGHYARMVELREEDAQHALRDLANAQAIVGGDPAGALERVRTAYATGSLKDMADEDRNWPFLLEIHARAGDARGVERALETGLEYAPPELTDEEIAGEKAGIYGHLSLAGGRWDEAVERYEEARRIRDCGACFLPELGIAHMEAGRTDEAIAAMEEWLAPKRFALFRAIYEPLLLERLGTLYEEKGDTAKAIDALGRFAERWKDADPPFRPRVEAARARIAALGGGASAPER